MRFRVSLKAVVSATLVLVGSVMTGCDDDSTGSPTSSATDPTGSGIRAVAAMQAEPAPRERIAFNSGWRFRKGDPSGVDDTLNYANLRDVLLANVDPSSFVVRRIWLSNTSPGARDIVRHGSAPNARRSIWPISST